MIDLTIELTFENVLRIGKLGFYLLSKSMENVVYNDNVFESMLGEVMEVEV